MHGWAACAGIAAAVFQRFWQHQGEVMDEQDEAVLTRLLELEDHDLWALISGKTATDDAQLAGMIDRLMKV
jgi:succinate dehydrogenase flavin-adding protein (antitoxin of CptAB toxin-antitoxin module)